MKDSVLIALATIIASEISLHMPWRNKITILKILLVKISKLLRSPSISDHFKEKLVPFYSFQLAMTSGLLASYLILIFLPYLIGSIFSGDFESFVSSLVSSWNIGLMLLVAFSYLFLRLKIGRKLQSP